MNKIIRRRAVSAAALRDGMLVEFKEGEPRVIHHTMHLGKLVRFQTSATDSYTVHSDDMLSVILIMKLSGSET